METTGPAPQAAEERFERRLLIALVLFGVAARVALCLLPRVIRWDEPDYLWLARSLATGGGYRVSGPTPDLHYPPLLPALFAPFTLLFANLERVGELWYVLCGALLPWPVYTLARRIYGRRVAAGAALLTAVFPLLTISPLYWGTMSEPPFLLLLFWGIDRSHAALRGSGIRDHLLAALALSLAYLLRPDGFPYLVLAGLWLLVAGLRRRPLSSALRNPALYALAALLVAGPYVLYLRLETGRLMVTGKTALTLDLWEGVIERDPVAYDRAVAGLDSKGEEILWFSPERFEHPGLLTRLRQHPRAFLDRVRRNLGVLAAGLAGRWRGLIPVAGLALLGMLLVRRRRSLPGDDLFLATMALPPFVFVAIIIQVRFFAPLVPILLIWVAAALEALGAALARWRPSRLLPGVPLALAAAGLLALWPPVLAAGRRSLDFGHKAMGLWLRDHSPPGTVVMARDLAVSLYARRGFCPSPHATLAEVLAYARARGATLWATDSQELGVIKPQLAALLDPRRRPPDLALLYAADSRDGTNFVFALPPAPPGAAGGDAGPR
jgi:Dolichyl-phosphate-mannose-protein mannosyltransferase